MAYTLLLDGMSIFDRIKKLTIYMAEIRLGLTKILKTLYWDRNALAGSIRELEPNLLLKSLKMV